MNIEQINSSKIIISLCNKELEKLSVTFETLNFSDLNSRKALKEILYCASSKTGIDFKNKRILIEVMQYENGCIFLVTLSEKNRSRKIYRIKKCVDFYTFIFDSADSLLNCINAIYNINGGRYCSYVFIMDGTYCLSIRPTSTLQNKYINTIKEFTSDIRYGKIYFDFLLEHAKLILTKNAIEVIGSKLTKYTGN